jgi:flavin reductase (DIM6/NTAB) family NADH-FMN oxidoreductase RutF
MEIDPQAQAYSENYKLLSALIIPRPIAWVSTVDLKGVANLAPFSYFTGVSSNPPAVAISIGYSRAVASGQKDTLRNIEETKEFVINFVSQSDAQLMADSAYSFLPNEDEFEILGIEKSHSRKISVPGVASAPARFECRLYQAVAIGGKQAGASTLIIGEIVHIHIKDAMLTDGMPDTAKLSPLARLSGSDYASLEKQFSIKMRDLWNR